MRGHSHFATGWLGTYSQHPQRRNRFHHSKLNYPISGGELHDESARNYRESQFRKSEYEKIRHLEGGGFDLRCASLAVKIPSWIFLHDQERECTTNLRNFKGSEFMNVNLRHFTSIHPLSFPGCWIESGFLLYLNIVLRPLRSLILPFLGYNSDSSGGLYTFSFFLKHRPFVPLRSLFSLSSDILQTPVVSWYILIKS